MSEGDAVVAIKSGGSADDANSITQAEDGQSDDRQTAKQMFFNIVKAYLGAGMLLIPYGMMKGGFI